MTAAPQTANQTAVRSGTSYWKALGPEPIACPTLQERTACEVAVIGGGITGALVGYYLSRAGVDVVLIDKGDVGAGSTAASTGLLQYEVDTPLVDLIEHVGETHAVHAYRRGQQAIDELEQLIVDFSTDCGFARRSTLCLASSEQDFGELQREYECRRHFGFDVSWVNPGRLRETWGFAAPGALHSIGDAEVDPYRLTQLALGAARSQGLRAFGRTEILNVCETAFGVELSCANAGITSDAAVFCTGYFAQPWFPRDATTLHTTYATCSEPLSPAANWFDRCLIWETARPYFYARQTPDGRAMIGGEDTPFADDHDSEKLLAAKGLRLKQRFEQLFAGAQFTPAYLWAGTFAETKDGLPFIGRPTGKERVYSALGYGGNGITFSMIAARLITDLIVQHPNDDAAVFRFDR